MVRNDPPVKSGRNDLTERGIGPKRPDTQTTTNGNKTFRPQTIPPSPQSFRPWSFRL